MIAIIVTVLTRKKDAKKPEAPAEETGAEPAAGEAPAEAEKSEEPETAEPAAEEAPAEAETETKKEEDE